MYSCSCSRSWHFFDVYVIIKARVLMNSRFRRNSMTNKVRPNYERPITRYFAARWLSEAVTGLGGVFNACGPRPDFVHQPGTHSPRLTLEDVDALEKQMVETLTQIRAAVTEDSHLESKIPSDPTTRGRCSCCGDDDDGADDCEGGHCQKCREAGCQKGAACIRPSERVPFYNPGDDAPHGWGRY